MSRLRNTENVAKVIDGQVLVNLNKETPAIGNTNLGLFGEGWHTVGWMPNSGSISITKDVETDPIEAWGAGVIDNQRTPGAVTMEFEVLEDNEITQLIKWANRENGVLVHDGKGLEAWVATVTVNDNGEITVRATRYMAELSMEDVGDSREVTGKTVTVDVKKGPQNDVFDETTFVITEESDIVALQQKIFVADSEINGTTVDTRGTLIGVDTGVYDDTTDLRDNRVIIGGEEVVKPEPSAGDDA